MLRRTGFSRPVYQPPPSPPLRRLERPVTVWRPMPVVTVPKEDVIQHSGYMNLVRAMPCMHCGRPPRSQFAHSDAGKGLAIKTDCRRGFPCCDSCHRFIGSTGKLGRAERRRLEDEYAARTRAKIIADGTWPARLPLWESSVTHE